MGWLGKTAASVALAVCGILLQSVAHGQQQACDNRFCFGIDWTKPSLRDIINLDAELYQEEGGTPVHYAARNCASNSVLIAMSEQDANFNQIDAATGLTPLQTAVIICRSETVKALLDLGADPNVNYDNNENTLHTAIRRKRPDQTLRALMSSGVNLDQRNADGETPLILMLARGRKNMALELLDWGADPDVTDVQKTSAAHFAAHSGDLELMRRLLYYGADFNQTNALGQTPLHFAGSRGLTPEVAAIFALAESNPNAVDDQGLTPLHYAAARRSGIEVATLLVLKADPNYFDLVGDTPLHYAIEFNQDSQAVLALLRLGADPNLPNSNGSRPLFMLTSSPDSLNKLDMLLGFGADLEDTDHNGESLLHRAVRSGNAELASNLLDLGVDPNLKNRQGRSALDIYADKGIAEPANNRFAVLLHNREVLRQQALERSRQRRLERRDAKEQQAEERRLQRREGSEEQDEIQEPSVLEKIQELLAIDEPDQPQATTESDEKIGLDTQLEELSKSEKTIRELLQLIQSSAKERVQE